MIGRSMYNAVCDIECMYVSSVFAIDPASTFGNPKCTLTHPT